MADEETRSAAIDAFAAVAQQEDEKVTTTSAEVAQVVATAEALSVRSAEEATAATDFLGRLKAAMNRSEEARVFLTKPLNDQVKRINARFKPNREGLEGAERLVKAKVIGFRREQERLAAEKQAELDRQAEAERRRLEDERARQEAEARAERERLAREAAQAEAEERRLAREQEEARRRQRSALEARIGAMTGEELERTKGADDERGPLAVAELERRAAAAAAEARRAAAREAEEAARAAEEEARSRPLPEVPRAVVAPQEKLAAASGSAAERKRWVATVVDPERVPRRFLKVDEPAINKAVREGAREIPGVRIEQVDELAVRAR